MNDYLDHRARVLRSRWRARTIQVYGRGMPDPQRQLDLTPRKPGAPKTRADCVDGPRPCPWVACSMNLFLDVSPRTGSIKLNFGCLEAWEMGESCALDIAEQGGVSLDVVGEAMNLTRERARQLEQIALRKLRDALAEWDDE